MESVQELDPLLRLDREQMSPPARAGSRNKSGSGVPPLDSLCAAIKPLARQLVALQKRANALGLFANDRELLECSQCGIMEDVTHTGLLITCREPALDQHTGLRFTKEPDQTFRCPSCGALVTEPLAAELGKARKQLEKRK